MEHNNKQCKCHEHEHNHEHEHCTCHEHECSCGHSHGGEISKLMILRLIAGIVIFVTGIILKNNIYLYILSYLVLGYDVLTEGVEYLIKKHTFSEHTLMSIASVGAFILGEYFEGVAVILLYQIGELFCNEAYRKSEKSIKELVDVKPEYANVYKDGKLKKVSPEMLRVGDIVAVTVGEKIPSDGVVIEGKTQIDTSKMTGEAEYSFVSSGDEVISGTVNMGSMIRVEITKDYKDSNVTKVSKLLDEIKKNQSESEKFITVFSKYYTPIVLIIAFIVAFFVPLLLYFEFSKWIYRALVFLVVSCPCALVISVPLAFFSAHGKASKEGVLIKGSMAIEKLSKIKNFCFDKTGTLTKGGFKLIKIHADCEEEKALSILAYAEFYSDHPLSKAVINEYDKVIKKEIEPDKIMDYTEIAGKGISVVIDGENVLVGNEKLLMENGIELKRIESNNTVIYFSVGKKYLGYIEFSDGIKEESYKAIEELKRLKMKTLILSGDKQRTVDKVGMALGVDEVYSELMPQEKVDIVKKLKLSAPTAFSGDGINDAPVLLLADVGISMGLDGTDAAIEASDLVVLSDDISKIPKVYKLSKRTMRIVREIIIASISVKAVIMILGAMGFANLWLAVFGDVGICILTVLNALRAGR